MEAPKGEGYRCPPDVSVEVVVDVGSGGKLSPSEGRANGLLFLKRSTIVSPPGCSGVSVVVVVVVGSESGEIRLLAVSICFGILFSAKMLK